MKIYDCFMFFDEEMLLDLRLNIMDKYVDKFVITEAAYMHSGRAKKLIFDINKYSKFKDKIIYNVIENEPPNIEIINKKYEDDKKDTLGQKLVNNSNKREHFQRNGAWQSIKNADPDDIILINDIDEIPNLNGVDFKKINKKIIIFKQKVFLYKFNLLYQNLFWYGSKICRKKDFISPQWLRDVKHKIYSPFRIDVIFSQKKYSNIYHVENGGWHFSNIKSPEDIEKKFSNYLHHQEYEYSGLNLKGIKKIINEKKVLYDHSADKTKNKIESLKTLKKVDLSEMPDYLKNNKIKYKDWIDD